MTQKEVILEAYQAGLSSRAIADRLIRVCGIDAVNAEKIVAAFCRSQKVKKKRS